MMAWFGLIFLVFAVVIRGVITRQSSLQRANEHATDLEIIHAYHAAKKQRYK